MREIRFAIPVGFGPQDLADTFTAYLLGKLAVLNKNRVLGPYANSGRPNTWRLTTRHPSVLEVEGSEGVLRCPDLESYEVANALVDLFQLQHNCSPPAQ